MIEQYTVEDSLGVYGRYLSRASAERHVAGIAERFPDDEPAHITTRAVATLHEQHIMIDGDVVGYQFNMRSQGCRTRLKPVSKLDYNEAGEAIGEIIWQGNWCYPVVYHPGQNAWVLTASHKIRWGRGPVRSAPTSPAAPRSAQQAEAEEGARP